MIIWSKAPAIGKTKFEWNNTLQDLILETTALKGTNLVCKCSGDTASIIVFFAGFEKSPISEIYEEFELGKSFGITYIITSDLNQQINIEADGKVFEIIKII